MKRSEFLRSLGLSSAALMATYCLGGLTACSNEEPDPVDQNNNNGGKLDFTLNLNDAANTKLKTNGEFIYKDNIIVARALDGTFVALSKACTHQGTSVTFEAANNRFNCPTHDSNFSLTGAVVNGPASTPLTQYKTEFNSTAGTLRVYQA